MAAFAHACFTAFIKAGAPACAGWPRYTPAADTLMEFNQPPALRTHFRKAQLDALNPPP